MALLSPYGVVNTIGGGFTPAIVKSPMAPPNLALARRQTGNPEYLASMDPRIKAAKEARARAAQAKANKA